MFILLFILHKYLLMSSTLLISIPPSVGRVSFPYNGSISCFRASYFKQAADLLQAEQLVALRGAKLDFHWSHCICFQFCLPCLLCLLIDSFYGIVFLRKRCSERNITWDHLCTRMCLFVEVVFLNKSLDVLFFFFPLEIWYYHSASPCSQ